MQPNNQNPNENNKPQQPQEPAQLPSEPPQAQSTFANQQFADTPAQGPSQIQGATQGTVPVPPQPQNIEPIQPLSPLPPQNSDLSPTATSQQPEPSFEQQAVNAAASIVSPNGAPPSQPSNTAQITNSPLNSGGTPPIMGGVAQANEKPIQLSTAAESQSKKKKIILALAGSLTLVVVAGISTFAYFAMQLTPEQLFAKSIINSASTGTLKQDYSASGKGQDLAVAVETDLSDPSTPKAQGSYNASLDSAGIKLMADYDFVCTAEDDCQVKFTKLDVEPKEYAEYLNGSVNIDKWEKYDPTKIGASFLDSFTRALVGIVTPLGEVVNGNIEGEALDLISKHAEAGDIFKINSYEEVDFDGMKTVKYTVEPDIDVMKEINEKVAEQYNLKNKKILDSLSDTPDEVDIWVDKKSKQIVQVKYQDGDLDLSIKLSNFNKELSIESPE